MTDILAARAPRERVVAHERRADPILTTTEQPERITWERVDTERYAVIVDGVVRGYVDVIGPVFVSLAGMRYDRAVEVAQSLGFDAAIDAVAASAGGPALTP